MKFQFLEKTICCMNVGFPPYFISSTLLSLNLIDNLPFSVDIGIDGAFSAGWSSHFWRSLARCSVLANRLQILIYWIGSYSLCNTGIFQCFASIHLCLDLFALLELLNYQLPPFYLAESKTLTYIYI